MAVRQTDPDTTSSPEGGYQAATGLGRCQAERHAQACPGGVLCRKGTMQRTVIPAPVYSPGRLTCLEPRRLCLGQWYWMRSRPVYACGPSVVIWPAADDLFVTPAALERLSSHAWLPSSGPMAEHPRPESDVRANELPVASHRLPGC